MSALGPDDLVLCPSVLGNPDISRTVEACIATGVAGVSLSSRVARADMAPYLRAGGIAVAMVEGPRSWTEGPHEPGGDPESDAILDMAVALGAPGVLAYTLSTAPIDVGRAGEGLAELCRRAAARRLWVAIEFLPWSGLRDLSLARAVLEHCGAANAGLVVDSWHFTRSGSSLEELEEVAPRVLNFQISDTAAVAAEDLFDETSHYRLLPGQGTADLVGIIRALDAGGARCPVAMEPFSDVLVAMDPLEATVRVVDTTRAVLATARAG